MQRQRLDHGRELVTSPLRILIVSFYYPPDLSAGSFRTAALVAALLEKPANGVTVDLITTMPNRYSSFGSVAPEREQLDRLRVTRVRLPPHRSGMRDQTRAFYRFWRASLRHAKNERYDLVYATSSRLMTAALGAQIARAARAPLYLDIRDIFVDTMKDVLSTSVARVTNPVFDAIERLTINRADHVNLVSRGFATYFETRYPSQSFTYFPNGIDEEFLPGAAQRADAPPVPRPAGPIRVLYAGNIGEGQGLHAIIPELAATLESRVSFRVIGDGGRRGQLEQALAAKGVRNVELVAPMTREALLQEYRAADVLFLHLNDYDAFRKVLPSKIFEYAALGKPVWAGVAGYAAEFLASEVQNAAIFPPCDIGGAVAAIDRLALVSTPRDAFVERFDRRVIMRAMAADVIRVATTAPRR